MHAPADKTAKRLSAEEWFALYGGAPVATLRARPPQQRPPADRIAVRS